MSALVIFLSAITLLSMHQQGNKLFAYSIKQAETANNIMPWGGQRNDNWKGYHNDDNSYNTQVPITPFPQFSPTNVMANTTPFIPVQQQFPTTQVAIISPEPTNPTVVSPNQPLGQDIGGISGQITQIQQQIAGQMQGCINNARKMANQIIQLQQQQKSLQNQLDAVNNQQSPNFDTSTPQGQQQQEAWQQMQQQKQQQLQQAIDALSTQISNAQSDMSTTNSNCQQNVSTLEQNRGQLEGNLDTAFSDGMNIQMPSN